MTNISNYLESSLVKNSQTSSSNQTQNTVGNTFSTELLQALMQAQAQTKPETSSYSYEISDYSYENSGDQVLSFTEGKSQTFSISSTSGKFTTTIDWSCYEKTLSDSQIASLSRQYGGELTMIEYAEAMKAIGRLANAKSEEDEVLEEMAEKIVYGEDELNSTEPANTQFDEFIESLNFYDIDKNTEFYNSDANIFDEFKLLYHNKNYDYEHFLTLLGEKNTDEVKFVVQEEQATQVGEVAQTDAPLNLNKYGAFSHLTPLIVQDIKSEIETIKATNSN